MRILGIDSSGLVASVAVIEDDVLMGEFTMNYHKTHSQSLLPMLHHLTELLELKMDSIDAIAIAAGPGSFTGLRIGAATAKGLGLALEKPIIPVPTVDALAYNLVGHSYVVCPLMDARRNQTYTGLYRFQENTMETILPQCAVALDEIIQKINELGEPVVFLGDGVPVFTETIEEKVKVPHCYAPAHCNKQRAAAVATLGSVLYKEGKFETAAEHKPEYLRLSQAERERMEKEKQNGHS